MLKRVEIRVKSLLVIFIWSRRKQKITKSQFTNHNIISYKLQRVFNVFIFWICKKKKKKLNNTGRLDFKISQGQGKISLHLDFNIKLNKEINKLLCQSSGSICKEIWAYLKICRHYLGWVINPSSCVCYWIFCCWHVLKTNSS